MKLNQRKVSACEDTSQCSELVMEKELHKLNVIAPKQK